MTRQQFENLEVGHVVQIDPTHDPMFAACFLIVTEIKSWGVQGYIRVPGKDGDGGDAYYRVPFERIEYIGCAEWDHDRASKSDGPDLLKKALA